MAATTLYLVKPPPTKWTLPRCAACCSDLDMYDPYWCARCEVGMHEECYWGRVASLAEWRDHLAHVSGPTNDEDRPDEQTPIICPACRQVAAPAKEEA